jgi:L-threonylcarbamoyladenylate synthase
VDPLRPEPSKVARIARALVEGGIVALPSDTVYGLSADARTRAAVERLAVLKRYRSARPFVVLFDGSTTWLDRLAIAADAMTSRLVAHAWPGPVTLIVRASASAPAHLVSPAGGIALRAPDHALTRAVLAALGGPIVSTSANVAGEEPLRDAAAITQRFADGLSLVVDGGVPSADSASTIVDATGGRPLLVRSGARALDLESIARGE